MAIARSLLPSASARSHKSQCAIAPQNAMRRATVAVAAQQCAQWRLIQPPSKRRATCLYAPQIAISSSCAVIRLFAALVTACSTLRSAHTAGPIDTARSAMPPAKTADMPSAHTPPYPVYIPLLCSAVPMLGLVVGRRCARYPVGYLSVYGVVKDCCRAGSCGTLARSAAECK